MSDAKVIDAAVGWYVARTAFLKLPAGDKNTRAFLSDLADAEIKLSNAVRDGVSNAFRPPNPNTTEQKGEWGAEHRSQV